MESRIRYVVSNLLERNGYLCPNIIRFADSKILAVQQRYRDVCKGSKVFNGGRV